MSTLYVTEYPGLGSEPSGPQAQAAVCPPLAEQTVAIGATHVSLALSVVKPTWFDATQTLSARFL